MKKNLLCLVALLAVSLQAANWPKPDPIPREQGLFRCQIHRGGGRNTRPDNSLETFLWCWGHGIAPEADARMTKDGVAIAMHDDNLKRIGRGITEDLAARKIADLTWDEIKDVDTGSYLGTEYSTTRLSTMESIFAAMKGRKERLLYVDEKGAPPETIAELAERFEVVDQVYYCSANWRKVVAWRKVAPKGRSMVWLGIWPKGTTAADIVRTEKFVQTRLDEMEKMGFDGIDQVQIHVETDLGRLSRGEDPFCPSTPFLRRAIDLMHKYGVTVNAGNWEGKTPQVYDRLWEIGFDHFTTDDPLVLFPIVERLSKGATK